MKDRILKELKSMMMPFVVGILSLPICYMILDGNNAHTSMLSIQMLIYLYMSVSVYGDEFKDKAITRLLAQPISRKRIWNEKLTVLFVSIMILLFYSQICLVILKWGAMISEQWNNRNNPQFLFFLQDYLDLIGLIMLFFLFSLAFISTGIYLSLMLKNSIVAFFGSLAMIGGIIIIWNYLFVYFNNSTLDEFAEEILCYDLPLLLCILIFSLLGYRKFMKLEVI